MIFKDLKMTSIENTCRTHNLTFKELFELSKKVYPRSKRDKRQTRYITKAGQKYAIKKTINCKSEYFGIYSNIEETRKVRDMLEKCNWDKNCLDAICKELGVEKSGNNK